MSVQLSALSLFQTQFLKSHDYLRITLCTQIFKVRPVLASIADPYILHNKMTGDNLQQLSRLKQRLNAAERLAVILQNIGKSSTRTIRRSWWSSLRLATFAAPQSNISGYTWADDVTTSLCSWPNRELSPAVVPVNGAVSSIHSTSHSVPRGPLHGVKGPSLLCIQQNVWR